MSKFSGASGIAALSADPSPTLAGNLQLNGHTILQGANTVLPETTAGDLVYFDGTKRVRLGIGSAGQALVVSGGVPAWATATSTDEKVKVRTSDTTPGYLTDKIGVSSSKLTKTIINPGGNEMVMLDVSEASLTLGNIGGTLGALKGGTGQNAYTAGDLLYADANYAISNALTKIAIGAAGQTLTVVAGLPAWAATNAVQLQGYTVGTGVPSTGAVLTWSGSAWNPAAPASTYTDPLTTNGDLVARIGGVTTRLGVGTAGQVLQVSGGLPSWQTLTALTNPMTTDGDLIVQAAGAPARLGVGSTGQVLTVVAGAPAWAAGGGSSTVKHHYQLVLPGQAASTIGQLTKAALNNSNPAGLFANTLNGSPGINNGGNDPFVAIAAQTIKRATLRIAQAAVGTGTFTSPATAKFDVYRSDYSSRTLLGTITFNVTNADIWNNLGSNRFAFYTATGLSIALAQGDCFGIEFKNEGSTNSQINALGGIHLAVEAEE